MTRHTRTRQIHNFRGTKAEKIINEPIKDAVAFYRGLEDLDTSFHTVTLVNIKHTYHTTVLGNYRLQKKLQKLKKENNGTALSLWDMIGKSKKNPKILKKHKYHMHVDDKGRFYTYELGRKTIYGYINDYDKNTRAYFDKLGNRYWW